VIVEPIVNLRDIDGAAVFRKTLQPRIFSGGGAPALP
jgi:hypothetical protein